MKLDFLNRVSGVRIPPSAPSKALRKECFLFCFGIMAAPIRNEKLEIRNGGGGFAANIYGAMPESRRIAGFPFEIFLTSSD